MTLTLGMEKRMKGWPGEPQMEYDVLMAEGNAAANAGRQITDVIFDFTVLGRTGGTVPRQ